jgi:multidrug efflux pump subunit AcrB
VGTREIGPDHTCLLVAVFLPVAFMGGTAASWFSFGLTMSFSIMVVSLVVSFTLTPMMCAFAG